MNTFTYKMLAMVVSSFLTGLGGTFYAFYLFSLQPATVFGIPLSVEIVIRPIVGGAGTLLGPILGSFILTPARRGLALYFGQGGWPGAHLIVYGVLLIAVVLFLPQGAYPFLRRLLAARPRDEHATLLLGRSRGPHQALRRPAGRAGSLVRPWRGARSGAHRAQRGGQDHRLQAALGLPRPRRRRRPLRRRDRSRGLERRTRSDALGLARTFQIVRPFPQLSAWCAT